MFKSSLLILSLLMLVSCGGKTTNSNNPTNQNKPDDQIEIQPIELQASGSFLFGGTSPNLVVTNPENTDANFGSIAKDSGISTYTFWVTNNSYGTKLKGGSMAVDFSTIAAPYSVKCFNGITTLATEITPCTAISLKKDSTARIEIALNSAGPAQVIPQQIIKINGTDVKINATILEPVVARNYTVTPIALNFSDVDINVDAIIQKINLQSIKKIARPNVIIPQSGGLRAGSLIGSKGFKVISNTCPDIATNIGSCTIEIGFKSASATLGSVYTETINIDNVDVVLTTTMKNPSVTKLVPVTGTSDIVELGTLYLDEAMPILNALNFKLNVLNSNTELVTGVASSHLGLLATQSCTAPVSKNVYCPVAISLDKTKISVGAFTAQVTVTSAQGISKPAIINAFFEETRSSAIDCSAVAPSVPAKMLAGVNTDNAYSYATNNATPQACVIKDCVAGFEPNAAKTACQVKAPVACSLPSDIAPLNNANAKIATIDTTKNVGSCAILTCVAGYQPAADAKSCVVIPVIKCSLPTNIAPLNNSNGKIATVDTTKDLNSCEILTCASGYVKSQDAKSCEVDLTIERSITVNKKLGGVNSVIPTATASTLSLLRLMDIAETTFKQDVQFPVSSASVIMNVADGVISSDGSTLFVQYPTEPGYSSPGYELDKVAINNATPVAATTFKTVAGLKFSVSQGSNLVIDLIYSVKCSDAGTVASIRQSGLIETEVATYKKNVDGTACVIDTCNATFTKSADELKCESAAVACTMENAVGNGLTKISGVLTVKGNVPNCKVDTCKTTPKGTPYSKTADELRCFAPANLDIWKSRAVDSIVGDISDSILLSMQGTFLDISLAGLALEFEDEDSFVVQSYNRLSGEDEAVLAPATVLSDRNIISGASSRVSEYMTYEQYIANPDKVYTVQSTLNAGLIHDEWEVGTADGDATMQMFGSQKVWAESSVTVLSVSADGKTLTFKFNEYPNYAEVVERVKKAIPLVEKKNITVIRGADEKDLKCAVAITGQPLVNDATMVIDAGPQSTINAIEETGNATVTLGACASGYSATLKEVESSTDMTATALSETYCINGVCSIPMNQDRFVKVEVTKTLYPFNALAILREDGGADEEIGATDINLNRATVNASIGDPIGNTASLVNKSIYTSTECLAYAGKIGAISLAVDPRCSGGLTKGSRNAIANRTQINLQEVYELKSWEMPAQGLVYATGNNPTLGATVVETPSTVSNTYNAIFGPKNDTITSDVDYYSKPSLHAIFPLSNDMIELYIRSFDVNLNNYVSNVTVQVLNSSQEDVTSRFTATCMNTNTLATVGPLTLTDNISQCINDRGTSKYLRLVFKYDTVNYNGETDQSLRAIIEDEYRTGSYTVNYLVTSKNIDSQNVMGTRLISYPIKINANNDIKPPMTISDASTNALVPEVILPSNGIPRTYNSWGSGIDYEIGQSSKRYNYANGAQLADATMYRNMDYNYTYPSISEKMAKIAFNKAYMPASSLGLAYNIKIRIQDRLNNCSFINDGNNESNIDGDHIASIPGIGTKTVLANVTNPLFVKYQFNGQHSTASRILLNSSDVATSALSSGCVGTAVPTGLGLATEADGSNLSPEITEKYDFIGNDNWVCEEGEVCYVNDLSKTLSNGITPTAKISMKSYVVRMRLISEDMEKTDAIQIVKVEKPEASVVGVANATFDVVPMVDNRMDPTNDGLEYGFAFDSSKLDFIDYKTPGNSSFKVGISNETSLCGSGSPCTYKFIRYANRSDDKGLNSTGGAMGFPDLGSYRFNDESVSAGAYSSLNNAVLSFTGVGGSNTFIGSTLTSQATGTDLHNNNMEVLAIIQKDNVTYKKMINMAAMHRIHEQPVMYAIKSIYSGGSLTGMKFIYDLNRYDEQGNAKDWTEANPTVGDLRVSEATYPQTVRQNMYPENHISFTTGMGARRFTNVGVQVGGVLSPATTTPTNYSSTEADSGFVFPISGSNLNFWKLARVNYADGPSLQINGESDNFHTYLNFKQCAEATPYYYYGQSGWACYSDVQAVNDGWK